MLAFNQGHQPPPRTLSLISLSFYFLINIFERVRSQRLGQGEDSN